MVKKFGVFVLAFVMTILVSVGITASSPQLYVWNSDSNSIGFSDSVITFKEIQLDSGTAGTSAYGHGIIKWASALPKSIVSIRSNATARFSIYYGTFSQLKSYFPALSEGYSGLAVWTQQGVGTATYYGNIRNVYRVTGGKACVVINSVRTQSQYRKTTLHEMGHLLGWFGHSTNSSDIMYSYQSSVTEITERDRSHLNQVYIIY